MITGQQAVQKVIDKIGSKLAPIVVPVAVEPYSIESNCFFNVQEKVERDEGQIIYGWSFLFGQFLCEAERHAIWKSPAGELLDVTPSTMGKDSVLFLPEDLDYHGQLIDNVRINITNNKVVDHWILICENLGAVISSSPTELIDNHTKVNFKNSDAQKLYLKYDMMKNLYYTYLTMHRGTESSQCFCGTSKTYKKCHGLSVPGECKRDRIKIDAYAKQ